MRIRFAVLLLPWIALALHGGDELRRAAADGDAASQLKLADEYFFGRQRPVNPTLAAFWFRRAALNGSAEGRYNLGVCYERGWGVPVRPGAAFHWIGLAARQQLPRARLRHAELLAAGVPRESSEAGDYPAVVPDPEAAKKLLRELLPSYPPARAALIRLLWDDRRDDETGAEVRRLLVQAVAEKNPESGMLLKYAEALSDGVGGAPDTAGAVRVLERVAASGDPEASARLAEQLEFGFGCPAEPERAMKLTRAAAAAGNPRALVNLGDACLAGVRLKHDPAEALRYYKLAAKSDCPAAWRRLGDCAAGGMGMERNRRLAFEEYFRAAEAGDAEAQYKLARCYMDGQGVEANMAPALYWLQRSVRQQYPDALRELGVCLLQGRGVDRNPELGKRLLRTAAELGNPAAEALLNQ